MPRDKANIENKQRLETSLSPRKLKRRSTEEERTSISPYGKSDERPGSKARKMRKLPSLESLCSSGKSSAESSPTARLDTFLTSTPRLKAVSERLALIVASPNKVITRARQKKEENFKTVSEEILEELYIRKANIYICIACKKHFKYFSNIRSHLKVVHKRIIEEAGSPLCSPDNTPRSNPHQCEICDRKFKYTSNLTTHRKVHSVQ